MLIRKSSTSTYQFDEIDYVEFLLSIFSQCGIVSAIIAMSKTHDCK